MPDSPRTPVSRGALSIGLTIVACIVLIVLLKIPGVFISLVLAAAVWLMSSARPQSAEIQALRSSIRLSAEDIRDVMAEFEHFETSMDPDSLADRTLHRPALLDLDTNDAEVEAFHYQYATAGRFLKRLPGRLANPMLGTGQLEQLLTVTDQRAAELKESWLAARRAAQRLGTNYKFVRPVENDFRTDDEPGSPDASRDSA